MHVPFTSPLNHVLSTDQQLTEKAFAKNDRTGILCILWCKVIERDTWIHVGLFSLVFHCVGSWISFKPLHFECSLISLAGGYTKGFQWRLGSRTGPTTTLKYFFFTIPLHSFLSNKFYCLKYLQVCVFFVCMTKSNKKKNTIKLFRKFVPYRNVRRWSYFQMWEVVSWISAPDVVFFRKNVYCDL